MIWLLRPIDDNAGPWNPWYDRCFGFVVRANSEQEARLATEAQGGAEQRNHTNPWLDQALTTCIPLNLEGPTEVIMTDVANA